ncbi:MAG: serine/threonine protein kinase [Candidatus Obscuribacterales bacterium]|nr:serine/threonine protein kinase [Candidatus Obscuribacterales bacterium]
MGINHPNVLPIFGTGRDTGGNPYVLMNDWGGKTLREVLETEGKIERDRCLDIFEQVIEGVMEAHSHGILHRCITPNDILICKTDSGLELVRVMNFGLSLSIEQLIERLPKDDRKRILPEVLGYTSPELCIGKSVTEKSDVYSLGCTLFEMLSGHPPFKASQYLELISNHFVQEPCLAEIERDFHGVIKDCLKKDPTLRVELRVLLKNLRMGLSNRLESKSIAKMIAVANGLIGIAGACLISLACPKLWFLMPVLTLTTTISQKMSLENNLDSDETLHYSIYVLLITSIIALAAGFGMRYSQHALEILGMSIIVFGILARSDKSKFFPYAAARRLSCLLRVRDAQISYETTIKFVGYIITGLSIGAVLMNIIQFIALKKLPNGIAFQELFWNTQILITVTCLTLLLLLRWFLKGGSNDRNRWYSFFNIEVSILASVIAVCVSLKLALGGHLFW